MEKKNLEQIVCEFIPKLHPLDIKYIWVEWFSFLNESSVCALYSLRVIIRMASFCNLIIILIPKPQQFIPNCKWASLSETYRSLSKENGKYPFNQFIAPNVRDILFAIFRQWLFQLRDSLITNLRKSNALTLSITASLRIILGISSSDIICPLLPNYSKSDYGKIYQMSMQRTAT